MALWLSVVVTRPLGTRLSCVLFSWVLLKVSVLVSRDLWRTTQSSRWDPVAFKAFYYLCPCTVWLTFVDLAPPSASGRRKGCHVNSSLICRFEAIILSSRNLRFIPWNTLISSLFTGVGSRSLLFAVFLQGAWHRVSFLSSTSIYVICTHYFDGGLRISQILHYDVLLEIKKLLFEVGMNSLFAWGISLLVHYLADYQV